MSRVQVSGAARGNFSPQRPRRIVRRSLFGPVDHGELDRDIEAKLREISRKYEQAWNFNFASGTPLLGDYEWEGAAMEATPVFYHEAVKAGKKRPDAVQVQPHTEDPNRIKQKKPGPESVSSAPSPLRKRHGHDFGEARRPDFSGSHGTIKHDAGDIAEHAVPQEPQFVVHFQELLAGRAGLDGQLTA